MGIEENDPHEPRLSDEERADVLKAASRMQARSDAARDEGSPLAEIERAAAEAGIEPRFVQAGMLAVELSRVGPEPSWLGPSGVWSTELVLPRPLASEEARRMIADLAGRLSLLRGEITEPSSGVWRRDGKDGALQVSMHPDRTEVNVVADRRLLRVGLVGGGLAVGAAVAYHAAFVVALYVGAEVPDLSVWSLFASMVGGALGGLGGWIGWKGSWRRWKGRTRRVLGELLLRAERE